MFQKYPYLHLPTWSPGRLAVALALLSVLAPGAPAALASPGGDPPSPLSERSTPHFLEARTGQEGAPLWVSVEAATTADGVIDWDLLGEKARTIFNGVEAQPEVSYTVYQQAPEMVGVVEVRNPDGTTTHWHHYGPSSQEISTSRWPSLADMAREAHAIYLGTVTAVGEGFLGGEPGSLLTVDLAETLYESDRYQAGDEIYVYYPYARFSLGGLHFWKETPGYPKRPEVGDRVLVSANRFPPDAGRRTILPHQDGFFLERRSGDGLVVKQANGRELGDGLDSIAEELRERLDEERGR